MTFFYKINMYLSKILLETLKYGELRYPEDKHTWTKSRKAISNTININYILYSSASIIMVTNGRSWQNWLHLYNELGLLSLLDSHKHLYNIQSEYRFLSTSRLIFIACCAFDSRENNFGMKLDQQVKVAKYHIL